MDEKKLLTSIKLAIDKESYEDSPILTCKDLNDYSIALKKFIIEKLSGCKKIEKKTKGAEIGVIVTDKNDNRYFIKIAKSSSKTFGFEAKKRVAVVSSLLGAKYTPPMIFSEINTIYGSSFVVSATKEVIKEEDKSNLLFILTLGIMLGINDIRSDNFFKNKLIDFLAHFRSGMIDILKNPKILENFIEDFSLIKKALPEKIRKKILNLSSEDKILLSIVLFSQSFKLKEDREKLEIIPGASIVYDEDYIDYIIKNMSLIKENIINSLDFLITKGEKLLPESEYSNEKKELIRNAILRNIIIANLIMKKEINLIDNEKLENLNKRMERLGISSSLEKNTKIKTNSEKTIESILDSSSNSQEESKNSKNSKSILSFFKHPGDRRATLLTKRIIIKPDVKSIKTSFSCNLP